MQARRVAFISLLIALCWCSPLSAAPTVYIVIDPAAPQLEQFAALEMSAQLSKLFAGDAKIVAAPPADGDGIILLGSPTTNPAVKQALRDAWPKLSDQGHLLKSAKLGDRPVLVVGGGSPVATLWAAYELGHQLGVRYLMQSDVYPPDAVAVKLDEFDIRLEPTFQERVCVLLDESLLGTSSWSLPELERLIGQLAKLKINRVWFEMGKSRQPGWWSHRFQIDGETAGRAAYRGAHEFTNPDLAATKTTDDWDLAAERLRINILGRANQLGMLTFSHSDEIDRRQWILNHTTLLPAGSLIEASEYATTRLKMTSRVRVPPGDLNPAAFYAARSAFDPDLKPDAAYRDLFEAVCGNREVAGRLVRGFELIDKATRIHSRPNIKFAVPHGNMLLEPFRAGSPPPPWLKEVKDLYTQSMIEMFRSHGNCRPSSKKYLYYHCKRGEFAVEYLNCYESVCLAGDAKKAGNQEKCVELLEKAIESLYNGINSLSEVARDQSDRGLIAALNEYAYRPLVKQLEEE